MLFRVVIALISLFNVSATLSLNCRHVPGYDKCEDYFDPQSNTSLTADSIRKIYSDTYCSCDELCDYYDDCCENAKRVKYNHTKPTCFTFPESTISISLIGSCPSSWRDQEMVEQCMSFTEKEDPTVNEIVVYSRESRVFYRNIFCAFCNNDYQNVKAFDLTVKCKNKDGLLIGPQSMPLSYFTSKARYNPKTRKWLVISEDEHISCWYLQKDLEAFVENETNDTRLCTGIGTCPEFWTRNETRERCTNYTSRVLVGNKIYRNIDCAECNGETEEAKCEFSTIDGRMRPPISLGFLLDVNLAAGNVIGRRECDIHSHRIYHPIQKRCVDFGCPSLFERNFETGECQPRLLSRNFTSINRKQSFIRKSCKTLTLDRSWYTMIENTTVYVNHSHKFYNVDEFEFSSNNESIMICADDEFTSLPINVSHTHMFVSVTCLLCSVTCLIFHLITYTLLPSLRTLPGKILMSLSVSLLIAHINFLLIHFVKPSRYDPSCVIIGVLTQYFYLSSFFWMNVMAFDVWTLFAHKSWNFRNSSTFIKYSIYAWLTPMLITGVSIVNEYFLDSNDYQPLYGLQFCWINQRKAVLAFFVAELLAILCVNAILFTLTVGLLLRTKKETSVLENRKENIRLKLYLKLALIMGFTWIFGFVAAFTSDENFWYPFVVLNGLQGVFITFAFSAKRGNYKDIIGHSQADKSRPRIPVSTFTNHSRMS